MEPLLTEPIVNWPAAIAATALAFGWCVSNIYWKSKS